MISRRISTVSCLMQCKVITAIHDGDNIVSDKQKKVNTNDEVLYKAINARIQFMLVCIEVAILTMQNFYQAMTLLIDKQV